MVASSVVLLFLAINRAIEPLSFILARHYERKQKQRSVAVHFDFGIRHVIRLFAKEQGSHEQQWRRRRRQAEPAVGTQDAHRLRLLQETQG